MIFRQTGSRGAIGSKTGKIEVLPGFRNIKGGSDRANRHVIGFLSGLGTRWALSRWLPWEEKADRSRDGLSASALVSEGVFNNSISCV